MVEVSRKLLEHERGRKFGFKMMMLLLLIGGHSTIGMSNFLLKEAFPSYENLVIMLRGKILLS